jgi:hypothetical protein
MEDVESPLGVIRAADADMERFQDVESRIKSGSLDDPELLRLYSESKRRFRQAVIGVGTAFALTGVGMVVAQLLRIGNPPFDGDAVGRGVWLFFGVAIGSICALNAIAAWRRGRRRLALLTLLGFVPLIAAAADVWTRIYA